MESSPTGWMLAGSVITAVLGAVVGGVISLRKSNRDLKAADRKDAFTEMNNVLDRQRGEIDKQGVEIKALREKVDDVSRREFECREEHARFKASALARMELLEDSIRNLGGNIRAWNPDGSHHHNIVVRDDPVPPHRRKVIDPDRNQRRREEDKP